MYRSQGRYIDYRTRNNSKKPKSNRPQSAALQSTSPATPLSFEEIVKSYHITPEEIAASNEEIIRNLHKKYQKEWVNPNGQFLLKIALKLYIKCGDYTRIDKLTASHLKLIHKYSLELEQIENYSEVFLTRFINQFTSSNQFTRSHNNSNADNIYLPLVFGLVKTHGFEKISKTTLTHLEMIQAYSLPFDAIKDGTQKEIEEFKRIFVELDWWGNECIERDFNGNRKPAKIPEFAINLLKTHGLKRLSQLTKAHFDIMQKHALSLEKVETASEREITFFNNTILCGNGSRVKYYRGGSGSSWHDDWGQYVLRQVNKYNLKIIASLPSAKHVELVADFNADVTKIKDITNEALVKLEGQFDLTSWRVDRNFFAFIFRLAETHGADRILSLKNKSKNAEKSNLPKEELEDLAILELKDIGWANFSTDKHHKKITLLLKRKDLLCSEVLSLSEHEIELLSQNPNLLVQHIQDPEFQKFYQNFTLGSTNENTLPALVINLLDSDNKSLVLSMNRFQIIAMEALQLSIKEASEQSFVTSFGSPLASDIPFIIALIKQCQNNLQVLYTFGSNLVQSGHTWNKARGLIEGNKDVLDAILKLKPFQIQGIFNFSLKLEQVQDKNFENFFTFIQEKYFGNMPFSIQEHLYTDYSRVFRLEHSSLQLLATGTSLEGLVKKQFMDRGLSRQQVNLPFFKNASKRDLDQISTLVKDKELGFTKRIFSLNDEQFLGFESGLSLDVVENPQYLSLFHKHSNILKNSLIHLIRKYGLEQILSLPCALTMTHLDGLERQLSLQDISDPNFIGFCERIPQTVRIAAFDLIKGTSTIEARRVFALGEIQVAALLSAHFTLEQVETQAFESFYKSIPDTLQKKALGLIQSHGNKIFTLTAQQLEGLIDYSLSLQEIEDIHYSNFYNIFLNKQEHLTKEEHEKNINTSLELVKKYGYQSIFPLIKPQIEALLKYNLKPEQVTDKLIYNLLRVLDNNEKENLFKLIQIGFSYERVLNFCGLSIPTQNSTPFLAFLYQMGLNSSIEEISVLSNDQLVFMYNKGLTLEQFKILKGAENNLEEARLKEDSDDTIKSTEEILKILPNSSNAFFEHGKAQYQKQFYADALTSFKQALVLLPNDQAKDRIEYLEYKALVLFKLAKFSEAEVTYNEILGLKKKTKTTLKHIDNHFIETLGFLGKAVNDPNLHKVRTTLFYLCGNPVYQIQYNNRPYLLVRLNFDDPTKVHSFLKTARTMIELSKTNSRFIKVEGYCYPTHGILLEIRVRTLSQLLKKENLPLQARITIAKEVCLHLKYFHDKNITHGDLRQDYIVLDEKNNPKLLLPTFINQKAADFLRWHAPEFAPQGGLNTKEADVYSFGLLLWTLANTEKPFAEVSDENLLQTLETNKLTLSKVKNENLNNLIVACCDSNPKNRPSLEKVKTELECIERELKVSKPNKPIATQYQNFCGESKTNKVSISTTTTIDLKKVSKSTTIRPSTATARMMGNQSKI